MDGKDSLVLVKDIARVGVVAVDETHGYWLSGIHGEAPVNELLKIAK